MSVPRRREKLQDIAKIADALRDPVETPDLTSSILERVHAQRPFVDERTRQWVPVVRVGAAAVAALSVFAVTLIIFIKPTLPEQLGAAPSVTTELFNSAEEGVTSSVAGIFGGMKKLGDAADPRRFVAATALESSPAPAPIQDQPLVSSTRPSIAEPLTVTSTPLVFAVQSPVPVAFPDASVFASAGRRHTSFESVGVSSAEIQAALRAHRGENLSQYKTSLASFSLPLTSPRPSVNRTSPALVKDLLNYVTGQPAGDDQVVR